MVKDKQKKVQYKYFNYKGEMSSRRSGYKYPGTVQLYSLYQTVLVHSKYIETGVGELSQDKLPGLLELKYHTISDATTVLGGIAKTRELFVGFQEYLYAPVVA